MIEHVGPIDRLDNDGQTPLCLAVRQGHLELVQLLLIHGADANVNAHP